jgi:hypothetical protein
MSRGFQVGRGSLTLSSATSGPRQIDQPSQWVISQVFCLHAVHGSRGISAEPWSIPVLAVTGALANARSLRFVYQNTTTTKEARLAICHDLLFCHHLRERSSSRPMQIDFRKPGAAEW